MQKFISFFRIEVPAEFEVITLAFSFFYFMVIFNILSGSFQTAWNGCDLSSESILVIF